MSESGPNTRGVIAFAAVVVCGAAAVWLGVVEQLVWPVYDPHPALIALTCAAFLAAEQFPVNYRRGGEEEQFTLSILVTAVALAGVGPAVTVLARLAAELIGRLSQRQEPFKLIANMAAAAGESVAAAACYLTVLQYVGLDYEWAGLVAAGIVGDAVSFVLIAITIQIYARRPDSIFDAATSYGVATAALDAAIGSLIVVVYRAQPAALVLLAAVPAIIFLGYRAHAQLDAEVKKLGLLTEFTTSLAGVKDDRQIAASLIDAVVRLTGAKGGWLVVESGGLASAVRAGEHADRVGGANDPHLTRLERSVHALVSDREDGFETAVLLGPSHGSLGGSIVEAGHEQLLVGSVEAGSLSATIAVADSMASRPWGEDDRATFATLTAQAGVALRAGNLADRLEREMNALVAAETIDPLTDLPNRSSFASSLDNALHDGATVAALVLDLDRFATVNDTLGHRSGDLLIRAVAKRLASTVRSTDLLARTGGDEFSVLLRNVTPDDAGLVAKGLRATLADAPFALSGLSVTVGASIGIALGPDDAEDADSLIRCANVALRDAKTNPGSINHYQGTPDRFTTRKLRLVTDLTRAIDDNSIEVVWQPQIELATRRIVGMEALARWNHAELGAVSPGEFIPIAEETGLIGALTRRVIRRALQDLQRINGGEERYRASINLSVHNLLEDDITSAVADILEHTGTDPSDVRFEITETAAMVDPTTTKTRVADLTALGCSISIDDFGTGYSSLAYLNDLEASEVKIDRVFTAGMTTDPSARSIATAIVRLAQELDLEIVAEGIENAETARALDDLGCQVGQGYHFGRPMPTEELLAMLPAVQGSISRRPR